MLTGKHMNQQAEIHIFINYSDLDKIRTDLKFNSAKVAGYLRYYKCKANSEGISKMTSNERQKKIIRLLDKRRKDTMEHLSIEFHVSTDTISRDIATLNEDYPIKIVRGRNGAFSYQTDTTCSRKCTWLLFRHSHYIERCCMSLMKSRKSLRQFWPILLGSQLWLPSTLTTEYPA